MKRTLAWLFALLTVFSLVSCSQPPAQTQTETRQEEKKSENKNNEKKEETKEVTYMTVEDPLTQADLDAIPIAKNTMNADQLRQICVDFFNLSMTFCYVPNDSADYSIPDFDLERTLEEGKLYAGLPYINYSSGNLYRAMEFYDSETGILDLTLFKNNMALLGNDCAKGANWGWARVVNTAKLRQTWFITPKHGYLKLGPYEYDQSIESFAKWDNPPCTRKEIADKNGEQVMYQSYALLQKADGIVNGGHVRMATENAVITKNGDTIDGNASYVIVSDQVTYNDDEKYIRTQSDGTVYHTAGASNWKVTFAELFRDGYLPFTFAEFHGTDPVEDGEAKLDYSGETISPAQLKASTLTTNYIMSDIFFKVTDPEGKELLNFAKRMPDLTYLSFSLGTISDTYFAKHAESGTNTIEISVQIGNGERLTAYKGTLVKE